MHQVVFVGGVPGSGKSQLCGLLGSLVPGLRHEIAGHIIRGALDGGSGEYVRPPVADQGAAARFQEMLVGAFSRIRAEHEGPLVLDGHFIVPTEHGPSPVGSDVFRRLGATCLVIVETEADVIARRLRKRPRPDWWDGRVETVAELLALERQQALVVADDLGLRRLIFRNGDSPARIARDAFGV